MDSENRTLRSIIYELIDNPFFPILFIGEFVKQMVENGVIMEYGALALIATILWVFSDVFTGQLIKEKIIGIEDSEAEETDR